MRTLIDYVPYARRKADSEAPNRDINLWPCRWISVPKCGSMPFVTAYRLKLQMPEKKTVRVHVSADERYELFLDGRRIGRGVERSDPDHWSFETYDLDLKKGRHVLVARVWSLGDVAPYAQMSRRPGFLCSPEDPAWNPILGTGHAAWEGKVLGGYTFIKRVEAFWTGCNEELDGRQFAWGYEKGRGGAWKPCLPFYLGRSPFIQNESPYGHLLRPALLPPMMEEPRSVGVARLVAPQEAAETEAVPIRAADNLAGEQQAWNAMLAGKGELTVPARTKRRILVDLDEYYCAYYEWHLSGGKGAQIRTCWVESLFLNHKRTGTAETAWRLKGNRNEIEGKYVLGEGGDRLRAEGGAERVYSPLWWSAGRYIEVQIETADEPLTIHAFRLRETRYPMEMESSFSADDPRLAQIVPIMVRGLQMCSHETFMDCPYYEQLMYVGDTRLEVLAAYTVTRDDRLPRKALMLFDQSRLLNGLTQSRFPSRVMQVIPPFSLWWLAMVHDYASWREDLAFVRERMPGVRAVLDGYRSWVGPDGLLLGPEGWNFMDWVDDPGWSHGIPPQGRYLANGQMNWQLALVLTQVAELEEYVGEPELAARAKRQARELAKRIDEKFWDEGRGCYADTLAHDSFTQHAQCLALLSGLVEPPKRARLVKSLLADQKLSRATIYFSHYLLEAYRVSGEMGGFFARLKEWFDLPEWGLRTPYESYVQDTRSDCHAWGSHPLFHYFASILGIRPAQMGFRQVRITPQLGPLKSIQGKLVHPRGFIEADLALRDGALKGRITLPEGVTGELVQGQNVRKLASGKNEI